MEIRKIDLDMMQTILNDLTELVSASIAKYQEKNPGRMLSFGLDCNVDYGNIYIAATNQELPSNDVLFSEQGKDAYWFGDWPSPNIADEVPSIQSMWDNHWAVHEDSICDWDELDEFEYAVIKQRFLEGVCGIAASLSRELKIGPILVADHDEHIRYTTSRLAFAYGNPTPEYKFLVEGHWEMLEEGEMLNKFAFLTSGEAINYLILDDEEDVEITCELDWHLEPGALCMMATETNLSDADFLWKEIRYTLDELTESTLRYRDEEQSWIFSKKAELGR